MIVGTIVKTISTGRLYCVWRGGTSESPARLRWKIIAQNIAPQVITPTTSAAMADHVQNSRMAVAWGVTPSGQPNRRASSTEHPVVSGIVTAARAASFAAGPNRCLPRCARPTARAPSTRSTASSRPAPRRAGRAVVAGRGAPSTACRESSRAHRHIRLPGAARRRCPTRSAYSVTVCGLLGLLTSGADAERRAGPVADALRCARHRGPDESGTWNDADVVFGFNRLSIIDVEGSHQPLRVRRRPLHDRLQRRDLQLPRAARRAGPRARGHVRDRGRHRGDRRRLPPLGPGGGGPPARDVRVPDLGRPGAGAVRRARPVRHQAAVLRLRPGRASRSAARRRACWSSRARSASPTAPPAAWTSPPCSTT